MSLLNLFHFGKFQKGLQNILQEITEKALAIGKLVSRWLMTIFVYLKDRLPSTIALTKKLLRWWLRQCLLIIQGISRGVASWFK